MKTEDELFDEIVADRPPGHFSGAEGLLRVFCGKLVEHHRLLDEIHDPVQQRELFVRALFCLDELADLAGALGLLPGDGDKPPLKPQ